MLLLLPLKKKRFKKNQKYNKILTIFFFKLFQMRNRRLRRLGVSAPAVGNVNSDIPAPQTASTSSDSISSTKPPSEDLEDEDRHKQKHQKFDENIDIDKSKFHHLRFLKKKSI